MHGPDGGGDDSGSDATGDGFRELVGRDWMIGPGTFDNYKCTRIQINEEMWITGFRSLSPSGTHHEIVTISDSAPILGDYDCNAGNLDIRMLYAAGIDTGDLLFPTGVAMHVKPGQYVNLNLHLFDTTDAAISGHSGVLVKTIPAEQVVNEADMTFAGTRIISIPSDGLTHTASGGCAIPADWHVFTLWPHMHQTATHQTIKLNGSMMFDQAYAFTDQKNYPMSMMFHTADQVIVTCSYVNTSGATLSYGESATAEMCFTGMYRYPAPANGTLFDCVN